MGTITINIKDNVEKKFRRTVQKTLGKGKGKLGHAVAIALEKWSADQLSEQSAIRLRALMNKGYAMGSMKYKNRAELHER